MILKSVFPVWRCDRCTVLKGHRVPRRTRQNNKNKHKQRNEWIFVLPKLKTKKIVGIFKTSKKKTEHNLCFSVVRVLDTEDRCMSSVS